MKKLFIFSFLLLASLKMFAAPSELDSLKQKLQLTTDSLKGPVYTEIANVYLRYDTIVNRNLKNYYQKEALNYTMLALHKYSRYGDSVGLKVSFDALAKVYYSQRKFSEAKWFNLQSASISRIKKDMPGLISSLIRLAAIKSEIKDYKLAMRDLNEALALSIKNKIPEMEALVQKNYGFLYNRMDKPEQGEIAFKRSEEIMANVKVEGDASMVAIQKFAQDSVGAPAIAPSNKVPVLKKKVILAAKKPVVKTKKPLPKKLVATI
ncbi:hypothetical protein A0256_14960 [Mucilaginibacter sp. PAMC 26640]|nr:hypothetical protein A0256_14960 [Mucilaginibacter sp. PAMC 26640]